MPITTLSDRVLGRADLLPLAGHEGVVLSGCTLDEADLRNLDCTGWSFERTSLKHANLSGATLELTRWNSCRGAHASFGAADLEDARLSGCDFNNASFRGAVLSAARFDNCKLTGTDLSEAKALDVRFANTLLVAARLAGFSFRKARLEGLDFSSADLAGCDFRDAQFIACSLREANIDKTMFEGADLRGADIGGLAVLREPRRFKGAVISAEQAELILAEMGLKVRTR